MANLTMLKQSDLAILGTVHTANNCTSSTKHFPLLCIYEGQSDPPNHSGSGVRPAPRRVSSRKPSSFRVTDDHRIPRQIMDSVPTALIGKRVPVRRCPIMIFQELPHANLESLQTVQE